MVNRNVSKSRETLSLLKNEEFTVSECPYSVQRTCVLYVTGREDKKGKGEGRVRKKRKETVERRRKRVRGELRLSTFETTRD